MQNLSNDFSSEDRTKTKNKIIHVFKKFGFTKIIED